MDKRGSIFVQMMGPSAAAPRFSLAAPHQDVDVSFKDWHRQMQEAHELRENASFGVWKWCRRGCAPCRWFDSIGYERKLCKCCLKFKTFKAVGTMVVIAVFLYIFLLSILEDDVKPGGILFFIFILFVAAYLTGYIIQFIGLPPMFGHLLIGITFGNVPFSWVASERSHIFIEISRSVEKMFLVLALIRAGLLLDLGRIKHRIKFIFRLSFFTLMSEFITVWMTGSYLLHLPWDWAALQGSVTCMVSLASITSIMEKNRENGYGEDKHLSTVLIAASALSLLIGMFVYIACISYVFSEEVNHPHISMLANIIEQMILGLGLGTFGGILIAFFPDKRYTETATLRIITVGLGAFAITSALNKLGMSGGGALGCITMCMVASNLWDELGWHGNNNPVQYFYSMAYYFGQPAALSLVGFSMRFRNSRIQEIGLSLVTILIGLSVKEIVCFITTLGKLYPTSIKEKLFICIAWTSKGSFQALLSFSTEYIPTHNYLTSDDPKDIVTYLRELKETVLLAILITTPLTCLTLTLMTPVLLRKYEIKPEPIVEEELPEHSKK